MPESPEIDKFINRMLHPDTCGEEPSLTIKPVTEHSMSSIADRVECQAGHSQSSNANSSQSIDKFIRKVLAPSTRQQCSSQSTQEMESDDQVKDSHSQR